MTLTQTSNVRTTISTWKSKDNLMLQCTCEVATSSTPEIKTCVRKQPCQIESNHDAANLPRKLEVKWSQECWFNSLGRALGSSYPVSKSYTKIWLSILEEIEQKQRVKNLQLTRCNAEGAADDQMNRQSLLMHCLGLEYGETWILRYMVNKMGNPMSEVKSNGKHEIFGMMHSWDLLSFGLHSWEGIGGRT